MYQALYRKWRPKTFSDIIGQDPITHTLKNQVVEGRTSHAYLFTGTRGTGKTTCARILAKAVNCENPQNGDPCGKCASCVSIENESTLDVIELDAASNNGVDQIRALRDEAIYTPANVKMRVYIVDEVHMLSTQAFNALLKILEEPPEHLMFILATTEVHKVPATILSRCQRFSFKRILPEDIARRLSFVAQQEKIELTQDGAESISRLADGALRDALSLLDQCAAAGGTVSGETVLTVLGLAGNLKTAELMGDILRRDAQSALMLLGELYEGGKDVGAILGELTALCRDLLLQKTAPNGASALLSGGYDTKTLLSLGAGVSATRLIYFAATLQKTAADLYFSTNRRADAELCILRLCDESLSGDLTALQSRVERLESGAVPIAAAPVATPPAAAEKKPSGKKKEPTVEPASVEAAPEKAVEPAVEVASEKTEQSEPIVEEPEQSEPSAETAEKRAASGASWKTLSERCKARLPGMYRAFLDLCGGVQEDGVLTVIAPDEMTLGRIDNDRVRGILQEEATEAAGAAVRVALKVGEVPKASQEENWNALLDFGSKFDNIEIK